MNKNIKAIFSLLLLLIVVTNVSALEIMKPATLDQEYTIFQTCASCTYVNITVSNSEGIIISNKPMTYNGSANWIYAITPTVASRHDVTGVGDKSGTDTGFATYFEVTPSGKVASTGDAILYSIFTIISFGWICLLSFFILTMPSSNERDDAGFEGKIVKLKYLRVFLIFLLYPSITLLLNFLTGLATNFTALSMFSGILGFLFEIMMRLSWPFTVLIIAWIIVMLVHDTNVNKQIDKLNKFDPFNGR